MRNPVKALITNAHSTLATNLPSEQDLLQEFLHCEGIEDRKVVIPLMACSRITFPCPLIRLVSHELLLSALACFL